MAKANLKEVEKKSAAKILTELALGFNSKDDYLRHLEKMALVSFADALSLLDERNLGISDTVRAENAFGRAAAFLMIQEMEIQRRLNIAVCGRTTK